jgi:asparagine synthase (glutamine-hydrolysing)
MCGIAGELRFEAGPSPADWAILSALMARRGPDDEGLWSDEAHCTLAFRRLAILDLSPNGHQPMATPDGRYALVFNGELYNFTELRARLAAHGVRFRSTGDAEVVLHALATWGHDALADFNGMFALALWDARARRLLLARDHVGIKPLYYLTRPQGLVFASQYDQILAHPWSAGLAVDQAALGLYLRLAFVPAPYGILRDTHMLEPGAWMEVDVAGRVRQGRFYEFPVGRAATLRGDAAVEAVDAAVTAAVRRQLVSDVPVGAFLSGGIDSPLVVAKMCAVSATPPRAFTIGSAGDASDESADAAAYARELGVAHVVEQTTPAHALALLDDVVAACGEPFGDYSIFPTMLVSKLARRECTVMLSGDGGDELFWGYVGRLGGVLTRLPELARPRWWRQARHAARRIARAAGDYDDLTQNSVGACYLKTHTHLGGRWLERVFPTLPDPPASFTAFDYAGTDPDRTAQWLRWNELTCHLTMVLLKVDRASMHHALEVRVPLLDREVVDVASRVDWRACLDPARDLGKLPLRQALARHVRHQTHAKRGFEVPMATWLRTSLKPAFESEVLARDHLLGLPLDRHALADLFGRHQRGENHAWGLWPLLSLALWARRHLEGRRLAHAGGRPAARFVSPSATPVVLP